MTGLVLARTPSLLKQDGVFLWFVEMISALDNGARKVMRFKISRARPTNGPHHGGP